MTNRMMIGDRRALYGLLGHFPTPGLDVIAWGWVLISQYGGMEQGRMLDGTRT